MQEHNNQELFDSIRAEREAVLAEGNSAFLIASGERHTGAFITIPHGIHSDYYGRVQEDFAKRYGSANEDFAILHSVDQDNRTSNGVYFSWDLASSEGAHFLLYQTPDVSKEDIAQAKDEIRNTRDALRIATLRIGKYVAGYRELMPAIRPEEVEERKEAICRAIAEASKQPVPEIVAREVAVRKSDGYKYSPGGAIPWDSEIVTDGFCYCGKDGTRYGPKFATETEARKAWETRQAENADNFLQQLRVMPYQRLKEQEAYWLVAEEDQPKPTYEARVAALIGEGLTNSDAQSIADMEAEQGLLSSNGIEATSDDEGVKL